MNNRLKIAIAGIVGTIFIAGISFSLGRSSAEKENKAEINSALSSNKKSMSKAQSSKELKSQDQTSESLSSEVVEKAETTEIDSSGDYTCGTDFNPGTYYVVLTKFDFANDDNDKGGSIFLSGSMNEVWNSVGSKTRVAFSEGDILDISDVYSPKWVITLYSASDYEKGKDSINSLSDNVPEVKSSSSKESSAVSTSTTTSDDHLVDNNFITISYDKQSNSFTIKNKTSKDITIENGSGPTLNGHMLNMYDGFASVDISANASTEEVIKLQNTGETIAGDKLHEYDYVKSGDNIIHVAGEIMDSDYNTLGNYSFNVTVKDSVLKD